MKYVILAVLIAANTVAQANCPGDTIPYDSDGDDVVDICLVTLHDEPTIAPQQIAMRKSQCQLGTIDYCAAQSSKTFEECISLLTESCDDL